jgi:hypothetical protein
VTSTLKIPNIKEKVSLKISLRNLKARVCKTLISAIEDRRSNPLDASEQELR